MIERIESILEYSSRPLGVPSLLRFPIFQLVAWFCIPLSIMVFSPLIERLAGGHNVGFGASLAACIFTSTIGNACAVISIWRNERFFMGAIVALLLYLPFIVAPALSYFVVGFILLRSRSGRVPRKLSPHNARE